jgi:hypothetical protein
MGGSGRVRGVLLFSPAFGPCDDCQLCHHAELSCDWAFQVHKEEEPEAPEPPKERELKYAFAVQIRDDILAPQTEFHLSWFSKRVKMFSFHQLKTWFSSKILSNWVPGPPSLPYDTKLPLVPGYNGYVVQLCERWSEDFASPEVRLQPGQPRAKGYLDRPSLAMVKVVTPTSSTDFDFEYSAARVQGRVTTTFDSASVLRIIAAISTPHDAQTAFADSLGTISHGTQYIALLKSALLAAGSPVGNYIAPRGLEPRSTHGRLTTLVLRGATKFLVLGFEVTYYVLMVVLRFYLALFRKGVTLTQCIIMAIAAFYVSLFRWSLRLLGLA